MTTELARSAPQPSELLAPSQVAKMLEQVIIRGNLNVLSPADKVRYYQQVCAVVGIPVELRPFEYIAMKGKEVLYVLRSCTEWLRDTRGIACRLVKRGETTDGLYEVVVEVEDRTGRKDFASGLISLKGLTGEDRANAIMKAETKAKRRATLSISGLGMLDESEIDHPGRSSVAPTYTPDDAPPPFQPWADSEQPEGAKRVDGTVTSIRQTSDSKGSIIVATVALEGDGGTIELLTRNMAAYDSLDAAVKARDLFIIRFAEVGKHRRLLSIDAPPITQSEPAKVVDIDPDTGKPLLF